MAGASAPSPELTPDANDSLAPTLLGVIWSMSAAAAVVLALRLYTAAHILRRVKLEDYLMLVALLCALVQTALLTVSAHWGLGRHRHTLSDEQVVNATKFFFLGEGWSVASTALGRISFSVYLLQFALFMPIRRVLLYIFIVGQALVNGLTIILIYAQCGTQLAAMWDPSVKATCWSHIFQRDFGFFQCSFNSLTDLFLTILPATIVWNLQISWRRKLGVSILLGVSAAALAVSIIKGYAIKVLGEGDDITYNIVMFFVWSLSEAFIIIIAASVPPLAPLVRRKRTGTGTYERADEIEMVGSGRSRSKAWDTPPEV